MDPNLWRRRCKPHLLGAMPMVASSRAGHQAFLPSAVRKTTGSGTSKVGPPWNLPRRRDWTRVLLRLGRTLVGGLRVGSDDEVAPSADQGVRASVGLVSNPGWAKTAWAMLVLPRPRQSSPVDGPGGRPRRLLAGLRAPRRGNRVWVNGPLSRFDLRTESCLGRKPLGHLLAGPWPWRAT